MKQTEDQLDVNATAGDYAKAFAKLFNCTTEHFEIVQKYHDGPYLVKYQDDVYEINSVDDISNKVEAYLTDPDWAALLPVELWIDVAEEVHYEAEFYIRLFHSLDEKERATLTQLLTISQVTKDPIDSFWRLLNNLGDFDLYPKAVIAACKTYPLQEMMLDLEEQLVVNGDSYLNELQGGIFETVDLLEEDEDNDECQLFYIFSVSDVSWEVSKKEEKGKKQKVTSKSSKTKKSK
ncbi:hypothetical protein ABID22_002229 [Pontibacter aydingkolensis]|uniref:Uncharacterized protein n=1 Tax=Pontibacter aydingkolensis TaxID=1911536 RepID=A0ABS7CWE9_9BACT|nr:hypothetical protein [Pontibacter aydingkolensis]MBW7467832.1 hypothetical protein [Pontibacter aydingkolensis]